MKHKGSIMECSVERAEDLLRAYRKCIEECRYIRMPDIYEKISKMPAAQFWVSSTRAALVISAMMKGECNLYRMHPLKREMYEEIYRRVLELSELHPEMTITDLCADVVAQPAPKFYLTAKSIKVTICRIRKKWLESGKRHKYKNS